MKMMLIGALVDYNNNIVSLRIIDKEAIIPDNYVKETGKIVKLQTVNAPLSQVKTVIKQGHNIEGVEINSLGEIKGTNGSFDRYPKFKVDTLECVENVVVILDKIEDKGFTVILVNGTIRIFKSEVLIQGVLENKTKIANGTIKQKNNTISNSKNPLDYFISSLKGEYDTITEKDYIRKAGLRFNANEQITFDKEKHEQYVKEAKERAVKVDDNTIQNQKVSSLEKQIMDNRYKTEIFVEPSIMSVKDKHGMTIEEKITRALSIIRRKKPFYYYILNQLKIRYILVRGDKNHIMSVTPGALRITPHTTINMPMPYIIFTLLHEASHICMAHHERLKPGMNLDVANIAMDLYVNEYLIHNLRLHRSGYYQRFLSVKEIEDLKAKNAESLTKLYYPEEIEAKQIVESARLRDNLQNYRDVKSTNLVVDRDFVAFPVILLHCEDLDLEKDTVEDIYIELMNSLINNKDNEDENNNQDDSEKNKDNEDNNDSEDNEDENNSDSEDNQSGLEQDNENEDNNESVNNSNSEEQSENKDENNENQNSSNGNNGSNNKDNSEEQNDEQSGNGSNSGSNSEEQSENDNSQSGNNSGLGKQSEENESTESNGSSSSSGKGSNKKKKVSYKGQQITLDDEDNTDTDDNTEDTEILTEEESINNMAEQSYKGNDLQEDEESYNKNSEDKRLMNRAILHKAIEIFENSQEYSLDNRDSMYLIAKKVVAPKIRWQTVILKYLTKASQTIYTYTAPDKRFLSRNMIMPGPRKMDPSALDDIAICIDTSGSISSKDLGAALYQIKQLFRKYKADGKILYWDTKVVSETKFKDIKEILESRPAGGGGTDANCVFEYFNTRDYRIMRKKRPSLIIMFTDGNFGKINPAYQKYFKNTIWIISGNGNKNFKPPFGVVAPFKNN